MPAFVVFIAGALGQVLAHLAGRIVFMLGVSAVTYTGVASGLENVRAQLVATYAGLPATMVQVLGLLRIDQAVLIVLSAVAARLALRVSSDAVTMLVQKAPPAGRL